ncbi:MAG: GNAT family N-acetyltransferase [Acidimicrobiales bacterium]
MEPDVRTIQKDDLPAWTEAMRVGFLNHASEGEADLMAEFVDLDRAIGAFDGERVVGTLRSFTTELTVPGGKVSCAALTNVTVTGTHRRRGLLTRMITRDLADSVERGEAVGSLIAAEYPIYGRFGYGPAVEAVDLSIDGAARFVDRPGPGSVELIERADLRTLAPELHDATCTRVPGAIARRDWTWDFDLGLRTWPGRPEKTPRFFVLGRDEAGRPDGYLTYHVTDHWQNERPKGTLHIEELLGRDAAAEERLWRYALEVDWIATVSAENRPVDDILPWLLVDARMITQTNRGDIEWVRVLDPVTALGGRRYPAAGRVVLEIDDPLGHAAGRFALEGAPDGAECRPTREPADLALSVSTLSAAYLGAHPLGVLGRAGRVDEHRAGALATADAMFRSPVAPWCITHF